MGLDMFLHRKSWVKKGDWVKPEFREEIKMTRGGVEIDTSKITSIVEEVGYWRKANAIHKWFVDNIQEGEDNCGEYQVNKEQLEELKSICEAVLKDIAEGSTKMAEELLPTQSGFFFGDTSYDEWYVRDLESTVAIIEQVLKESTKGYLTYSSSW